jgi:hypothetical protein
LASQEELMTQALAEMKKATYTPHKWCTEIDEKEDYDWVNTHNFKAQQLLWQAAHANPNPTPPTQAGDLSDVQRCLFLTDDTSWALDCPNRLLIATADLNYRKFYSFDFVQEAIKRDVFRVWCDCHETFPPTALEWLDELELPHNYFYGECESAKAFKIAYEAGSRHMIGNLSVLTSDDSLQPNPDTNQLGLVKAGKVHITNEYYLCKDPNATYDWRNANAGIGSNATAVYESATEGTQYYGLVQQASAGKIVPERECHYVAGYMTADWHFVSIT